MKDRSSEFTLEVSKVLTFEAEAGLTFEGSRDGGERGQGVFARVLGQLGDTGLTLRH